MRAMQCRHGVVVAVLILGAAAPARGQPEPAPTPAPAPEPTQPAPGEPAPPAQPAPAEAIDWSAAPPPDQASGIAERASTPTTTHLLWIPRVVLFIPRWAFWAVAQPFRLIAWAYEHYHLPALFKKSFFNVDETYGIYPVARYDTQFGFEAGVRFVHRNLFGAREKLRLRANFGGPYRQAYGFTLGSGERFGKRFSVSLDGRYQRKPGERFFGIGNGDEVDLAMPPPMLIDPTTDPTAVETRYREDLWRGLLAVDAKIWGPFSARLSAAINRRTFGGDDYGDDFGIQEVYTTTNLTGFGQSADTAVIEGDLIYDSRRTTSIYMSKALDAAGWFIDLYGGGSVGLGDDPTEYHRYGGEIQTFIDLYRGSRILALRVLFEEIGGTGADYSDVPIPDLPRLGGVEYLRGYSDSRFRDRALTLGTAEYIWDLGNFLAGFAFIDVGRVWPHLKDFELEGFRFGYGGGIQAHSRASFLLRLQIAASRGGDLLFEFTFSPVFGRRERVGRLY